MKHLPTLHIRPGHRLIKVLNAGAGRCVYCKTPIVTVLNDNGLTCEGIACAPHTHCGQYPTEVHADGSPGHTAAGDTGTYLVMPDARCPKCKGFNVTTVQEAYGDRTTCADCKHETWYDIGD